MTTATFTGNRNDIFFISSNEKPQTNKSKHERGGSFLEAFLVSRDVILHNMVFWFGFSLVFLIYDVF